MADASSSSSPSSNEIEIVIRAPSDTKLTVSIDTSKTVAELKEIIAAKCDIEKDRQRLIYSGKVLKDEEKVEVYKIKWVGCMRCVRCVIRIRSAEARVGRACSTGSSRNGQCIHAWTVKLTGASCLGSTFLRRPGNTVHLVKGASKAPAPPSAAQVPQNIQTGQQIAGNPLAPLMNGALASSSACPASLPHPIDAYPPFHPSTATNQIGNFNPFAQMGMNTNDPVGSAEPSAYTGS